MTPTTETLREQAFLPMRCDVPEGQTLREWSARRRRAAGPGRRRRRRRTQLR